MSRDDVFGSWSKRYAVGLSAALPIAPISGQNAVSIKLISGGTLEVGGSSAVGQSWGDMYFVSAGEILSFNMSGTFYLWASAATCTVAIIRGRSAGTADTTP